MSYILHSTIGVMNTQSSLALKPSEAVRALVVPKQPGIHWSQLLTLILCLQAEFSIKPP